MQYSTTVWVDEQVAVDIGDDKQIIFVVRGEATGITGDWDHQALTAKMIGAREKNGRIEYLTQKESERLYNEGESWRVFEQESEEAICRAVSMLDGVDAPGPIAYREH